MARPLWNGTISFGLLNIPVQLFTGERSEDLSFRMLDSRNRQPVRYERVNAETGEEVPWADIVKAFEYDKGSYVVIDEDEIRAAAPDVTETVEIEAFVDRAEIDPRLFEKPYYLVPGPKADKGYVLLREILKRTGKVGIAKVVIRTRQYLAALMPCDDALVLDLMRFSDELVSADEFRLPRGSPADYRLSPKEIQMGEQLIESMTTEWNPEDYEDDFRIRLRKIIDARIAEETGKKPKGPAPEPPPRKTASNVVDFTALLQRSLAGKKASPAPKGASGRTPRSASRTTSGRPSARRKKSG